MKKILLFLIFVVGGINALSAQEPELLGKWMSIVNSDDMIILNFKSANHLTVTTYSENNVRESQFVYSHDVQKKALSMKNGFDRKWCTYIYYENSLLLNLHGNILNFTKMQERTLDESINALVGTWISTYRDAYFAIAITQNNFVLTFFDGEQIDSTTEYTVEFNLDNMILSNERENDIAPYVILDNQLILFLHHLGQTHWIYTKKE